MLNKLKLDERIIEEIAREKGIAIDLVKDAVGAQVQCTIENIESLSMLTVKWPAFGKFMLNRRKYDRLKEMGIYKEDREQKNKENEK